MTIETNLVEKYAWVDQLLEEKYNLYALTEENVDDFIDAGLLVERYPDNNTILSTPSPSNYISNPFCNIEVEQRFNELIHIKLIQDDDDTISEISSNTNTSHYNTDRQTMYDLLGDITDDEEEDSIFLELIDEYDSDDYYDRFGLSFNC